MTTTTTTAATMNYNTIDSDIRDYIWGGCALEEKYEPYREEFEHAAELVADYDRDDSLTDPETGDYTPEGAELTERAVADLCNKILGE